MKNHKLIAEKMKKYLVIIMSICLSLSVQGCGNQSVTNQQADSFTEKEETKDTTVMGLEAWYDGIKDTTININSKQIYVKMEIVAIQGKFVLHKSYGDYNKEYIEKFPDTEINIQISDSQYKLQKQEIPNLNNDFLSISMFQQINFHSFTEEAVTFDILFGEPETDNGVFILLTIDLKGNKSFKIEYPEWEEDD